MPNVYVPFKLKHKNKWLYEQAIRAKTQESADRFIRVVFPDWTWEEKEDKWFEKITRHDIQAAGQYSLECSQGGSWYHVHGHEEKK